MIGGKIKKRGNVELFFVLKILEDVFKSKGLFFEDIISLIKVVVSGYYGNLFNFKSYFKKGKI